jgi:prepilin-type N-terminal cleavage/methylation domain-containing protein
MPQLLAVGRRLVENWQLIQNSFVLDIDLLYIVAKELLKSNFRMLHNFKLKSAFTLVELLVVIAIIGLLSTLSIIVLSHTRSKARDVKRLSDVKQISTALEIYYSNHDQYPVASGTNTMNIGGLCLSDIGISSTCGSLVYLRKIPTDPLANYEYQYRQLSSGDDYRLSASLENSQAAYPYRDVLVGPNGSGSDLLAANNIDWRNPVSWNCNNITYDADFDALKIDKVYSVCLLKNLIPINTTNNYYLSAEYMTTNDSENKLFYMGSYDYSGINTPITVYNYNYFAAGSKYRTNNIWVKVGNSQPHTGESTTDQSNQWRPGTNYTKIMFLANYNAPVINQVTYIRNIRFYTE